MRLCNFAERSFRVYGTPQSLQALRVTYHVVPKATAAPDTRGFSGESQPCDSNRK